MEMNENLLITNVEDVNGNIYYIDSIIGQGGQGVVYRTKDRSLAVKCLLNNGEIVQDSNIYKVFKNKINDVVIINIDDDIKLCKPEIMLKEPMCGYVMKLLEDLKPVNDLIYVPGDKTLDDFFIETQGLKKRIEVLIELSRTLVKLHSQGIVYCDLSPNNVFYSNTDNFSNVWLIDCDNLKFSGENKKGIFTPGYGAPEVVRGATQNTIYSDCFSFAVLAFKLLTNRNPFEINYDMATESSNDWDKTSQDNVQGYTDVDWIGERGIIEEEHDYFKHFIYKELLELFDETFNKNARNDASLRPSMRTWYEALKIALTRIYKCECGSYLLSSEHECPFCGTSRPFRYYFSICNLYDPAKFANVVDEITNDLNGEGSEYISEEERFKLKSNYIETKYAYPTLIYNGLQIYNFNIYGITTYEHPYPVIKFEYVNNNLYVTNKSNESIFYKYKQEQKKLLSGDKIQIPLESKTCCTLLLVDKFLQNDICIVIHRND